MALWQEKGKGWRFEFQVQGKRYVGAGFKTKTEARAAMEKKRKEIKNEAKTPTVMLFSEIANEYLDYCQRKYVPKTYQYKASVYRNFINICGDVPITEISVSLVEQKYLATRQSNSNYNKHRKDLCALFRWAWKRRLLDENPCLYIEEMPTEPKFRQIYSQEDIARLFVAGGEHRVFLLALFSLAGRLNEINRLRWEDVNFEKREVCLWTRKGNGEYREQVKPLNEELGAELLRLYGKASKGYIFPNPETGLPYVDRRKQLKRMCREAGVEYKGFHAVRHFAASLLSDVHKVSLPTVQKMLGHSRLTTTERYVRSLGQGVREAGELLTTKIQVSEENHTLEPHTKKEEANANNR